MADGPGYEVPFRRRREGRTNYKKRLAMLKSGELRAAVRISNKHAQVQIIAYDPEGDETVVSAVSNQLENFGWEYNTGNISAAYLTGLLAGYRAQAEDIDTVIPDLGTDDKQYGTRHYAVVQGLRDSGLDMNVEDHVLPGDDRINGEHADAYESEGMTDTVETVKEQIIEEYGE